MRQPNGPPKRPLSIPSGARPKSPPPPRPPVHNNQQNSISSATQPIMKIPGLPGYQKPIVNVSGKQNQYDDCLNSTLSSRKEQKSPSSDNIYAVIEETPVTSPDVKNLSSGSSESVGLLGEIVSEIQNRNFDSIYSTSTLSRKKEVETEKAKSSNSETYVNTSSMYKAPESVYSNMNKSSASSTSSGYINPSSVNIPLKDNEDFKPKFSTFKNDGGDEVKPFSSTLNRSLGPLASIYKNSGVKTNKDEKDILDLKKNNNRQNMNRDLSPPKLKREITPPKLNKINSSDSNKQLNSKSICANKNTSSALSQQLVTPGLNRQMTPPNINKQVTTSNLNRQITPPNLNKQITPPNLNRQITPPNLNRQVTPPNLNRQVTPPNLNKQGLKKQITPPNLRTRKSSPTRTAPSLPVKATSSKGVPSSQLKRSSPIGSSPPSPTRTSPPSPTRTPPSPSRTTSPTRTAPPAPTSTKSSTQPQQRTSLSSPTRAAPSSPTKAAPTSTNSPDLVTSCATANKSIKQPDVLNNSNKKPATLTTKPNLPISNKPILNKINKSVSLKGGTEKKFSEKPPISAKVTKVNSDLNGLGKTVSTGTKLAARQNSNVANLQQKFEGKLPITTGKSVVAGAKK